MAQPERLWRPVTAAVAPHLIRLLSTPTGGQPDDFDGTTTIRAAEVELAITSVLSDVEGATGPIPEVLHDYASSVVAIGAAAEAVVDFDAELSAALQALYEARLVRLVTAATDARDGAIDGARSSVPASGLFPEPFPVDRMAF